MPERPPLTPELFDEAYTTAAGSHSLRELIGGDLPEEVDPYSFVPLPGLVEIVSMLGLAPGSTLVDLACGRGGPGLWFAGQLDVDLIGVDFSPVAIRHAIARAERAPQGRAWAYVVADVSRTGLSGNVADGVVCIDAIQLLHDQAAFVGEVARLLMPGGRAVFTTWEDDERLPDVRALLEQGGLDVIDVGERPDWSARERRIFETAVARAPQADDPGVTMLAEEAELALPMLARSRRVIATAIRQR